MKAVTPLISVILLLLITIAIVGFTYTWFTRFSTDVTEELSNETEVSGSKAVRIEALSLQTVTLKNIGTKAVPIEDLQIYVNDIPTACNFGGVSYILPGQTTTCTELVELCTFGSSVRITTPSGFDVYTCPQTSGTTTTVTTTTTLPGPPSAYLSVVLDTPSEGSSNNIVQNNTFVVKANVTCVGTGSCGNVNGTLRRNSTLVEPDIAISTVQGAVPFYIVGTSGVLNLQISQGSDDADERADTGSVDTGNINVKLDFSNRWGGFRFRNVTIPQGAIITNAVIEWYAGHNINNDTYDDLYGEATDNASTFFGGFNSDFNISSRPLTTSKVTWVTSALSAGFITSPDISGIIQETVNRAGWRSGNSLAIISDHLSDTDQLFVRSFEDSPAAAARLNISYATSPSTKNCGSMSAGQTCQLNWTMNATGLINSNWNIDTLFVSDSIAGNNTGNAQINIISPIIFFDTFSEAANIELSLHTPAKGINWTRVFGVGYNNRILSVKSATDVAGRLTTDFSAGSFYVANTTYSSANYKITVKAVVRGSDSSKSLVAARVQDSNNMYAVQYFDQFVGGAQIHKKVSGAWTSLGSSFSAPVAGDNVTLIVNGTNIIVEYNGIQKQSVTDGSISSAGMAGLGAGEIVGLGGSDLTVQEFDNFIVEII